MKVGLGKPRWARIGKFHYGPSRWAGLVAGLSCHVIPEGDFVASDDAARAMTF